MKYVLSIIMVLGLSSCGTAAQRRSFANAINESMAEHWKEEERRRRGCRTVEVFDHDTALYKTYSVCD